MKVKILEDKRQMQIVDCSNEELEQLKLYFTRKIKNWRFNPLVKKKLWNGEISFLNKNLTLSTGLWGELKNVCNKYSYDLEIINKEYLINLNINKEDFYKFIEENFNKDRLYPRDYQIDAAFSILKYKRSISEIATSAGKTLIIFIIFAYLYKNNFFKEIQIKDIFLKEQFLVIVPNVDLVVQTYEKFIEYNELLNEPLKLTIQMFGGSAPKIKKNSNVIIGTFHTLRNLTDDYFETVKLLCVDEAHYTNSNSVQKILKKCVNAEYRFGLSGTLKADETADSFTLQASLGPMVNKISAEFLFDNKYATPVNVAVIELDYLENEIREKLAHLKKYKNGIEGSQLLNLEKKIIIENKKRLNYIINVISKTTKNSLVLFHNVKDEYGKNIYEKMKDLISENTNLFYIDGSVNKDLRGEYRNEAINNENGNYIIIASFGTMSTGIDISNIENIYLLESFKSEIIIKQTIGRGMRLNKIKKTVNIYDFVDDFRINNFENYIYKHSKERIRIYKNENYNIKRIKIKL
jgi:superfamily II DNA or RNA helicase